ncbi:hypothetical protein [Thiohalorhabdus sp.]|uniref:hypothetical protein n=1 Tax=Thiohalorhabdus sp. TaxID=3094134 RepID=UPI002FC2C80F
MATIYTLAQSLGIEFVAKEVDTRTRWQHRLQRGHRDAEGFYPAQPQPATALRPRIRSGRVGTPAY